MPLYFFDVDGPFRFNDTEGEHYDDARDARAGAVTFLVELLRDRCREVHPGERWTVSLRDEYAVPIFELTLCSQ